MAMLPFRCSFGEPHHGWLPVSLASETTSLTFEASDVPNNPIQDLIDALEAASQNFPATVWWHLEPDGYYFKFRPLMDTVELRILFAKASREYSQTEIVRFSGSHEQILLPFWRELRKFEAAHYEKPHWPHVDFHKLPEIGSKLRQRPLNR